MKEKSKVKTIDKLTIAKSISNELCITIVDALEFIECFQRTVINAVKNNQRVQLNDFITISTRITKERKMTSYLNKKEYNVPSRKLVAISVGKKFKQLVGESEIS